MRPLLRWAGRGLLILYVFVMIVVLGFRYWFIPNIDQWRQPISSILSNITQSDISIGTIQAQWEGLYPELVLQNVSVGQPHNPHALHIPYIATRLQLESLLKGEVVFSYLRIDGLRLSLRRDSQQRFHIAGQTLESGSSSNFEDSGFLHWLAQQKQIELENAILNWHDQWRDQPPITLTRVQGMLLPQDQRLHYKITAQPPDGLGQRIRLQGALDREQLEHDQLSGTMYVHLQGLSAEAWHEWAHLPTGLVSANMDAQLWLQLAQSEITELGIDLELKQAEWQSPEYGQLHVEQLRFFAQGPWAAFNHYLTSYSEGQAAALEAVQLELYATQTAWRDNPYFAEELLVDELRLITHTELKADQLVMQVPTLFIKNTDFELDIQAMVKPDLADWNHTYWDLHAQAKSIQLNSLYKYFPMPEIPAEVVEWLRTSLVAGYMPEAVFRWQGSLADYPYQDPRQGIFYVGGPIQQAVVDYYPPSDQEKGWPKVESLDGVLMLRGNQLWVRDGQSVIKPDSKQVVHAQDMQLEIDDFSADEPWLTLTAQTDGPAQAYLGLMTHSDLGGLLDHAFVETTAMGRWQVPLDLRVNLENTDQFHVAGHIAFDNNTLRLLPWLPALEQVQGHLLFDEKGAEAKNIKARWLGGPVTISQRIGAPGQALQFKGQLELDSLAQQVGLAVLGGYLQGKTAYQAQVGLDQKQQFFVMVHSELAGVNSSFPEPLQKTEKQVLPLTLEWSAANTQQHGLRVQLDSDLQLYLLENSQAQPLFEKGYLIWRRPMPKLSTLGTGLWVDIENPQLDLDQWQEVLDRFETTTETSSAESAVIPLRSLRIKAEQAYALNGVLNQLTFTTQQTKPLHWRSDISSAQVAGTVQWQENTRGQVQGVVDANFQRVHWLPRDSDHPVSTEPEEFLFDLADLDLRIDEFKYDSLALGSVTGVGRRSAADPDWWQIQQLNLKTPYGQAQAHGGWRLRGPQRGLSLEADLKSETLGALLDYVGFKGVLAEGKGQVVAELAWQELPWSTALDQLQANFEFDLERGRLNQVQSGTGKLLELLSLQSISRLTTLGTDLRGLLQNGFPFDQIKGRMQLTNQLLHTDNFTVLGPVGTILLEGDVNLRQESLDINAVVVPRMDMSGAALAAGIALNPVVGISAFLTQWLLKEPLAKAMTVHYHLSGPWAQPQMKEVQLNATQSE